MHEAYTPVAGPSFETPAEIRFRLAGANRWYVHVHETIVARHGGIRCWAFRHHHITSISRLRPLPTATLQTRYWKQANDCAAPEAFSGRVKKLPPTAIAGHRSRPRS